MSWSCRQPSIGLEGSSRTIAVRMLDPRVGEDITIIIIIIIKIIVIIIVVIIIIVIIIIIII